MKRISTLPIALGILSAVIVSGGLLFQGLLNKTIKPKTGPEYSLTSVMITRYDGRSGGSGVIISSDKNSSQVLTNAHVCGVIKNGGIVRSDFSKGIVKSYKVSQVHDLCMITTNNNFKINTVLASEAPDLYEDAIVAGHPHLLPTIVTRGHFSQKELITILIGTRPCTPEDLSKPENSTFCAFFNAIPIIKTYEAQVISSTIMPGSSGSPVFNNKGEISGLVFAGSGDFGYAMIVPFEYISNFFEYELHSLQSIVPNDFVSTADESTEKTSWSKICNDEVPMTIKKVCEMVSKSLLLTN